MKIEKDYSVTDSAAFVGVSRVTLYRLIKLYGIKPVRKMAMMSMYSEKDLKKIIKKISL